MACKNEAGWDRAARAVLAVVLVGVAVAGVVGSPWNLVAGAAGAIMALTAAVGFCPLYMLVGRGTCAVGSKGA